MRVPAGGDIGVHANCRRGAQPQARRLAAEQLEFGLRFHVDQANAGAQRLANLFARLADA